VQITPYKNNNLLLIADISDPDVFIAMGKFPAHTRWIGRSLAVKITRLNVQHAINNWPEAEWLGGSAETLKSHEHMLGISEDMRTIKNSGAVIPDDSDYQYARQPMDHQRKAFALSRDRAVFALLMQQGTGKTKVTIDSACYLANKGQIDGMIIVAWPNGVHRNWIEYELPVDMSIPYDAVTWTPQHKTKRKREELERVRTSDKFRVIAFNAEAFTSDAARKWMELYLNSGKYMLVVDQSASIKNPQANRTKYLTKVSKLAPYRRILDGQPVAEGAGELYSQFKFLDSWIIGHNTWTGFKSEFCQIGYFNEIVGYRNLETLHKRIDGHCYRVLADDCLDLPDRIYKMWHFDLSNEERKVFDQLKVQDFAFFEKESDEESDEESMPATMEETLAMVKNMRLQQISSGWFKNEDELLKINKESPSRMEALKALIEQNAGQKHLIFARFRADLELIQEVLGDKAVSFHGGIDQDDRDEAKRKFMNDDSVLYFIGQPQTAGIGHTLTAAQHVVFYANDPSLRLREECEKRAHRKGLKHKLHIWDLVAGNTQDSKIIKSLREKKLLSEQILQDPKSFFMSYE